MIARTCVMGRNSDTIRNAAPTKPTTASPHRTAFGLPAMPLATREDAPPRAEIPLLYWLAVPRGGALILRVSPEHYLQPMETPTD